MLTHYGATLSKYVIVRSSSEGVAKSESREVKVYEKEVLATQTTKALQLLNFLPTFPFFQLRAFSICYKIINLDDLDIINEFSNRVKSYTNFY